MTKKINIDAEYNRFHGQKAIDRFFKRFPEVEEWKETFEWMLESGTEHFSDELAGDGSKIEWTYSLWLIEDEDITYMAVIIRE